MDCDLLYNIPRSTCFNVQTSFTSKKPSGFTKNAPPFTVHFTVPFAATGAVSGAPFATGYCPLLYFAFENSLAKYYKTPHSQRLSQGPGTRIFRENSVAVSVILNKRWDEDLFIIVSSCVQQFRSTSHNLPALIQASCSFQEDIRRCDGQGPFTKKKCRCIFSTIRSLSSAVLPESPPKSYSHSPLHIGSVMQYVLPVTQTYLIYPRQIPRRPQHSNLNSSARSPKPSKSGTRHTPSISLP